jgi:hypothetical protein
MVSVVSSLTWHVVVRDPGRASSWYLPHDEVVRLAAEAFPTEEQG